MEKSFRGTSKHVAQGGKAEKRGEETQRTSVKCLPQLALCFVPFPERLLASWRSCLRCTVEYLRFEMPKNNLGRCFEGLEAVAAKIHAQTVVRKSIPRFASTRVGTSFLLFLSFIRTLTVPSANNGDEGMVISNN